jgi:hypothetical protein
MKLVDAGLAIDFQDWNLVDANITISALEKQITF